MKSKIMEVLMSADNNLSQDEINWAIQNIPNDSDNPDVYDHDRDSIFEACGIFKEDSESLIGEYNTIKKIVAGDRDGNVRHSEMVQMLLHCASPKLLRSFVVRGVADYENDKKKDVLEALMKKFFDRDK